MKEKILNLLRSKSYPYMNARLICEEIGGDRKEVMKCIKQLRNDSVLSEHQSTNHQYKIYKIIDNNE